MKLSIIRTAVALLATLWLTVRTMSDEPLSAVSGQNAPSISGTGSVPNLAAVESTRTGLLLEPPIDLSKFSHETFVKYSADVGANKINKAWTTAVQALPPHSRKGAVGLTDDEVAEYMRHVSDMFDRARLCRCRMSG